MRSWQFVLVILLAVCASVACDKSGEIESSQPAGSAIGPTIANLVSTTKQLSKASGGILRLSCDWSSPWIISTGTAYLIFVRSIQDTQASPTGVIGSGTASHTNPTAALPLPNIMTQAASTTDATTTTASQTSTASDSPAFFARFKDPLSIPLGIGTDRKEGVFSVEIPFPTADISDAPLGNQQMLLWILMNGVKTNSLALEVEFIP